MNQETIAVNSRKARLLRILGRLTLVSAILLLLAGLLGYFWLPGYAKHQLETVLTATLKRPVTIARIAVSPYALEATVEGFKVGDVLSVGSLYLNLSSASLLHGMPVVQELRITEPKLHLVRESDHRLNVSDLLDDWAQQPPSNTPTPEFAVGNITLSGGQIEWEDRVVGKTQTLSDIRLGVPFISNAKSRLDVFVEPQFDARLNGAPLDLDGKIHPFAAAHDAAIDIKLDGIDLTRFTAYVPLPVSVQSALLDLKLQLQFRHAGGSADALTVAGDVGLRKLQGEWKAGKLTFDLPQLALHGLKADVLGQKFSADELALQSHESKTVGLAHDGKPLAQWGELKLVQPALALPAHQFSVAEIQLADAAFNLARTQGGTLDVMSIGAQPATLPGKQSAPVAKAAATPSWNWSVGKVAIKSGKLHFSDETVADQVFDMTDISAELGKLSGNDPAAIPLTLKSTVNEHGALAAEGTVALDGRADLKLDLSQVDLAALQGWVMANLNAVLTRGDLSFNGELHAVGGKVALNGNAALGDFNVLDRINAEDMLRWKRLKLDKLALKSQPFDLSIGEIALNDFFAQLLVDPKGKLNLKGIVKDQGAPPAAASVSNTTAAVSASAPISSGPISSAPVSSSAVASAPVAGNKAALPVRIGKITLSGGNIDFSDEFIKPNYSARLTGLSGRIGALAAGTQSPIDISGKIDRTAPLKILGTADPFASPLALNVQASAKGIDLPNLSAYSGRYLGYAIAKGKLSVDVSYRIDKGELVAENKIFLDQLTLGEKVASAEALDIPLSLAISLLQNSRGEIDLDVPIRGSLNDPKFNLGGIVVKVIVNLIVKAVTAPFALLGSLFGGGEDLSSLTFPVGSAVLGAEGEKRMQAIAKAMTERPALKTEITGYADPLADRDGLKRALLERKIKASKLADQARHGKRGSMEEVTLTSAEYEQYLTAVYDDEKIPDKPRNLIGMAKSLPAAEMEQRLLAYLTVSENDLAALAEERGQAAQNWLVAQGGIAMERIFLLNAQVAATEKGVTNNRVGFALR